MELPVDLASEREMVIGRVVQKAVDHFFEGDYDRALVCYNFSEVLDGMSDEEFTAASVCTDPECDCQI